MQHIAIFEEQVSLTPRDMQNEIVSIDAVLLAKLQQKLEGKCSKNGFVLKVLPDSLSRSMGVLEKGRFTGSISFHLQAEGAVLNPPDGIVIEGEVIRKNKMGIYVSYEDAVRVIVPRDLHIGNEEFDAVQVGEIVKVEIKKSRFQVNDPYILSVGVFQGVSKKLRMNRAASDAAPEEEAAVGAAPAEEGGEAEEEGAEAEDAEEGAEEEVPEDEEE